MNGNDLSLVDISYSPVFLSLSMILPSFSCEFQKKFPKVKLYFYKDLRILQSSCKLAMCTESKESRL